MDFRVLIETLLLTTSAILLAIMSIAFVWTLKIWFAARAKEAAYNERLVATELKIPSLSIRGDFREVLIPAAFAFLGLSGVLSFAVEEMRDVPEALSRIWPALPAMYLNIETQFGAGHAASWGLFLIAMCFLIAEYSIVAVKLYESILSFGGLRKIDVVLELIPGILVAAAFTLAGAWIATNSVNPPLGNYGFWLNKIGAFYFVQHMVVFWIASLWAYILLAGLVLFFGRRGMPAWLRPVRNHD